MQLCLTQIIEMMHMALLQHENVIDKSALHRGAPAAFGNKIFVFGGNFILGWTRASVALSRLGDSEVTKLIVSVLSNLIEGEILQMREVKLDANNVNDQLVKKVLESRKHALKLQL
jgi:hexaprenyl-diphosphate synthase